MSTRPWPCVGRCAIVRRSRKGTRMGELFIILGFMVVGGVVAFICAEIEWRIAGKPRISDR